jgi:hypothetical protein
MANALLLRFALASAGNAEILELEQGMKLRCKSGDLALVTHDEDMCRQNIGKLVRVAGPIEYNRRLKKQCWLIEPVKAELWQCVTTKVMHYQKIVTFASNLEHPDDWLLPIDPEAWSLDEEVKVEFLEFA